MQKEINEHRLLVCGYSNLEGIPGLEVGDDVELIIKGTVRKVEQIDTDEGTIDICYKIKQLSCQVNKP